MLDVIFDDLFPMSSGYGEYPPKLTALTFFHPRFTGSSDLIDLLDMLDMFSANYLDIFIKGFTSDPPKDHDKSSTVQIRLNSAVHYFSAETLRKDVEELQKETSWYFSMELDVILVKQTRWYNKFGCGVHSDYENAVVLNLYRMLECYYNN
jgi:hypothetical protein